MVSTAVCPCFIGIWIHFQLGWDSDSLFGGNCAACLPKLCSCFVFHLGSSISLKLVFRNPVCNLGGGGGKVSSVSLKSHPGLLWRKRLGEREEASGLLMKTLDSLQNAAFLARQTPKRGRSGSWVSDFCGPLSWFAAVRKVPISLYCLAGKRLPCNSSCLALAWHWIMTRLMAACQF